MLKKAVALGNQLIPLEDIFFRWLIRVMLAALLIGSAWIDDAPPLELAAWLIAGYVVVRVIMQFVPFADAAPFNNRVLKVFTSCVLLVLLGLSFLTVVTLVDHLALLVAR